MQLPYEDKLALIVTANLSPDSKYKSQLTELIKEFLKRRDLDNTEIATDQLLNAVYMVLKDVDPRRRDLDELGKKLLDTLWKSLSN